jgi:parallel beta-helix repeat protein
MLLSFLLFSCALDVQTVKAQDETIYILRSGDVYTFTEDVSESIVVEKGNVTIDGNGYTLQGLGNTEPGIGITVDGVDNVTIQNINIQAFQIAIDLYYSSYSTVSNNIISDCGSFMSAAIAAGPFDCYNNTFTGNILTNTHGNGFSIWGLYHTISGNAISNHSGVAIELDDCCESVVFGNNITSCTLGIRVLQSDNRIFQNNFVDNTNQAESEGNNSWDNGFEGNFWSDYTGADTNADGIGDVPYVINENNQDNCPLVSQVDISAIPEYSSFIILSLLMVSTLVIVINKNKLFNQTSNI